MAIKFGTDGVRGEFGSEVTAETAYLVGKAASEEFDGAHFVMAMDTRVFNPELALAFKEGVATNESKVFDLGILPTPAAALIAGELDMVIGSRVAAVSLSASHNPAHDAGIKVFGPGGVKLDDETTERIQDLANNPSPMLQLVPTVREITDLETDVHRRRYLEILLETVDPELRRDMFLSGHRILVDAANGAAYWSAPAALKALGADVIAINTNPSKEINKECGAAHPKVMFDSVNRGFAPYGIALDGDADRLIAYTDGRVLDGDDSLVIAAERMRHEGNDQGLGVVHTTYSNLGLEDYLASRAYGDLEVANGDRYILEGLAISGYPLGGEQSGHTIYAHELTKNGNVWTGDGTLAALQQLQTAALLDRSLSDIAGEMTKTPLALTNVSLSKGVNAKNVLASAAVQEVIQGVRGDLGGEKYMHVRASGTEPIIRILGRGYDQEQVDAAVNSVTSIIKDSTN